MKTDLIHIVDDDDAVRRSLSFLLKLAGYRTETHASGNGFLKAVDASQPGCVLLDVCMPDLDGLQVQAILKERGVALPVIVLTGHGDVAMAVEAMQAGAVTFMEKPYEKARLLTSVEEACSRARKHDFQHLAEQEARLLLNALTARERDVLDGLASGLPNKSIAFDLGISPRTVEIHRANLMSKLSAHNLADVLRIAIAAGIGTAFQPAPYRKNT